MINLPETGSPEERVQQMLKAVRLHLGMDVGFVSEFKDGRRFFRHVDAASSNPPIAVGGSSPLEESYCHLVVTGVLPELMQDAGDVAAAAAFAATKQLPVGAHLSVPIHLGDGSTYGTFCCFSHQSDHSLNQRDLALLKLFADVTGKLIQGELLANKVRKNTIRQIEHVIEKRQFSIVYQPLYRLSDRSLAGFEALSRFSAQPLRSPDYWFAEAHAVNLGLELELATAQDACTLLLTLESSLHLGLNFSPSSIPDPRFKALFDQLPVERLVLEITEHAAIENYTAIGNYLAPLRQRGLRLAVDDAGAGHASFRHVLELKPDIIKLDVSLVRDIYRDPARLALAEALTRFGRAMGSLIVAEGVETELEFNALRDIGVTKVQGYFLGRPVSLQQAAALPLFLDDVNQTLVRHSA
jgi:EAL domain-containing protein (putative c-di-GMP-specific phosphodiesterase class I)